MERLSMQELAAVLVTKSGLKKKDAERFASVMFEVVKDGLAEDRQVKIKGLGTFKVIEIDSRESVDVNTGERVLIEGHDKITFMPDATMKEIVNKPFSQFETVVLNDGVEFDDDLEQDAEPEVEPELNPKPEPVQEEPVQEEPAPLLDFIDVQEEQIEEHIEDQPAEAIEEDYSDDGDTSSWKNWIWWLLGILLAFGAGFWLGRFTGGLTEVSDVVVDKPMAVDSVKKDTVAVDTLKTDTLKADSFVRPTVKTDTMVPRPIPDKQEKSVEPKTVEPEVDYGQMDARVRTGAYRIVGTAQQVKVRAGETLKRISTRYLGPDMECYVEVYNSLKPNAMLKEGQTLKIPKLELKKKKKQQIKQ